MGSHEHMLLDAKRAVEKTKVYGKKTRQRIGHVDKVAIIM